MNWRAVAALVIAVAPNVPGVRYFAVAGRCDRAWVGPEWLVPYSIVNEAEGPNDGVVSVASATWGEHTDLWDGDHLNLVNWPNRIARKRGMWVNLAPDYGRADDAVPPARFAVDGKGGE